VFSRTGKAIEQSRQMEVLEQEIETYRENYMSFLENWEVLTKQAAIHIPELEEKLIYLRQSK